MPARNLQVNGERLWASLMALAEIGATPKGGVCRLALSDLEILRVMSVARETRALVMVHAENYDAIRFLTDKLEQAGRTAPKFHATSRPIAVEREATHRAIALAEITDVPVMIVHVSNRESMEEIRRAQQKGLFTS